MKKVIRLTESELTRLVKRVISENEEEKIRRTILRRVLPSREDLLDYIHEFNYDYTYGDLAAGYEPNPDIFSDDRIFVGYEESPPLENINTYVELLSQHIITKELDDEFGETEDWFEKVSVQYWNVMKSILFSNYPEELKEGWKYYTDVTKSNMEKDK